ncbi:orotidine-5'-phosphate decarboxylase [Thalassobacillus cyri]|uniref:Orotidine 5'-phosphate decarboxylase n=1 Tax=Thalassobacillus cyri TaxID=571932 RepID=A0A1H4H785_9BACI|nr:orotidine-5'-phosphate decarboxylase [Thalassobacillus cyri]
MKNISSLYVALDIENKEKALQFLKQQQLEGAAVKVGMELFYHAGPSIITSLKERNHDIFLDLKLHDIPTTVKNAMRNLARLDVDMVNVHAQGGREMITAAKQGLEEGCQGKERPVLLAVTQLTSTDQTMMAEELRQPGTVEESVIHLAKLAKSGGADGVVCSVQEVKAIKAACGSSFLTVTPGIRPKGAQQNDQKRSATPLEAKQQGTDAIVVGRAITAASDPYISYQQIIEEWNHG